MIISAFSQSIPLAWAFSPCIHSTYTLSSFSTSSSCCCCCSSSSSSSAQYSPASTHPISSFRSSAFAPPAFRFNSSFFSFPSSRGSPPSPSKTQDPPHSNRPSTSLTTIRARRTGVAYRDDYFPSHSRLARVPLHPPPVDDNEPYPTFLVSIYSKFEKPEMRFAQLVANHLKMDENYVKDLMAFGAVWMAELMKPEVDPKSKKQPKKTDWLRWAYKRPRYIYEDFLGVPPGIIIKVYVNPRRWKVAHQVDWKKQIIFERNDFIVVEKPQNIPLTSQSQNALENVVKCCTDTLQLNQYLKPLYDMEFCQSGLAVLAKSYPALIALQEDFYHYKTEIHYQLLITNPIPLGEHTHCARAPRNVPAFKIVDGRRVRQGPRIPFDVRQKLQEQGEKPLQLFDPKLIAGNLSNYDIADMEVLSCRPVFDGKLYEAQVRLLTQKQQKIRAQLAAMGSHLFNDYKYRPEEEEVKSPVKRPDDRNLVVGPDPDQAGLHCSYVKFKYNSKTYEFSSDIPWWRTEDGEIFVRNRLDVEDQARQAQEAATGGLDTRIIFHEDGLDALLIQRGFDLDVVIGSATAQIYPGEREGTEFDEEAILEEDEEDDDFDLSDEEIFDDDSVFANAVSDDEPDQSTAAAVAATTTTTRFKSLAGARSNQDDDDDLLRDGEQSALDYDSDLQDEDDEEEWGTQRTKGSALSSVYSSDEEDFELLDVDDEEEEQGIRQLNRKATRYFPDDSEDESGFSEDNDDEDEEDADPGRTVIDIKKSWGSSKTSRAVLTDDYDDKQLRAYDIKGKKKKETTDTIDSTKFFKNFSIQEEDASDQAERSLDEDEDDLGDEFDEEDDDIDRDSDKLDPRRVLDDIEVDPLLREGISKEKKGDGFFYNF